MKNQTRAIIIGSSIALMVLLILIILYFTVWQPKKDEYVYRLGAWKT